MALFNRQKNGEVPAELQLYYDAPKSNTSVLQWVIRVVVLAIIALLVVLFVRWVWHQTHTPAAKAPSHSQITKTPSTTQDTNGSSSQSSDSSSASDQSPSTAGQSTAPATGSTSQQTNLTNTGPGDVVALFVGTVVITTSLYQLRLRQKLAN